MTRSFDQTVRQVGWSARRSTPRRLAVPHMTPRSHLLSPVAVCVAVVLVGVAISCIYHPGFRANSGPTIWLTGEVRVWPDSVPGQAVDVALLGGPAMSNVLARTTTWRDGRFALQLGSSTQIDCTTLRVLVTKLGYVSGESRPGQLRCTRECQWVDLRIRRAGMANEVDPVELSPVSCEWIDGYPAPKRPA